jgi:hypothetical protein
MPIIYDLARHHFESPTYPDSLPIEASYIHIGFFLGWAIENNLVSDEFEDEFMLKINHFKQRQISCTLVSELWDGHLTDEMLNRDGRLFAEAYYLSGYFLKAYKALFPEASSIYYIEDTWENYQKVAQLLTQNYDTWREERRKQKELDKQQYAQDNPEDIDPT